MKINLEGRARLLGDDINTDYIISSSRKKESLDPHILKQYLLESVDPAFAASVLSNDIVVAGKNFGCGSAMEIASTVLLAAGIKVILARSFARTFYRNSVNNGLIPVECDTSFISEGDQLELILADGQVRIHNRSKPNNADIIGSPLPTIMLDILFAGGLVPYFRQHHDFKTTVS
jgi:3-isopropylmalate/(R)-2-methylmalate dehydratase small subunit